MFGAENELTEAGNQIQLLGPSAPEVCQHGILSEMLFCSFKCPLHEAAWTGLTLNGGMESIHSMV